MTSPNNQPKEEKPRFEHPQPQSDYSPAHGQVVGPPPQIADIQIQLDSLDQKLTDYINRRINLNTDILGLLQTVTKAPVQIPNSIYQQVQIAIISGTTYLYIYDVTQPAGGTASNGWFRVALS